MKFILEMDKNQLGSVVVRFMQHWNISVIITICR